LDKRRNSIAEKKMKRQEEADKAINWFSEKFSEFEESLNGAKENFAHKIRKDAILKLNSLRFPTLKTEEWKYTNILPILKNNFEPVLRAGDAHSIKNKINPRADILFYNGIFSQRGNLSNRLPKGVIIKSMKKALTENSDILARYIGKLLEPETGFDALNSAFMNDGLFVFIPRNTYVEDTVFVSLFTDRANGFINLRNLIILEENASLKLVFERIGEPETKYFANEGKEIFVGKNSSLEIYSIQKESREAFQIKKTKAVQEDDSRFSYFTFSFGGKIARDDIGITIDGSNAECNLYGLYMGKYKQHIDNHTFINHAKPYSSSNEFYKGILDKDARGVFAGKIYVSEGAQKTNAYQSNKTILLSETAEMDTKPQLEIYADDVKCSHGATVGQLDEIPFFYLLSRGIPRNIAKTMLVRAFANDVVEKVSLAEIKEELNELISEKLNSFEI
jgi:Fe-S cluster assembly protein SufD